MIPCSKFKANSFWQQLQHVFDECRETQMAYVDYTYGMRIKADLEECNAMRDHVAEELVDIQVSCETALMILGFSAEEREAIRAKVDEKNRKRGYHE